MSNEQIINKSNVKKIKRKLIIEEEDFDITRMKELPQYLVDYCFSFLSTPETSEQRLRLGSPDFDDVLYRDGALNAELMKKYKDACDRFFTQTEEQKAAWWNRPAVWWIHLVRDETVWVWENKHYPVVAARFQKMSNARLTDVTERLCYYAFNGGHRQKTTKKQWIINLEKNIRRPTTEETRKKILELIILSKE